MRIKLVGLICVFIFLFLAAGLLNLGVIHYGKYRELSEKNCIRLIPQPGSRGKIISSEGSCLADNYLAYDIMLLPQDHDLLKRSLKSLAAVLNIGLEEINARYKAGYISPSMPVTIMKNVNSRRAIAVEEAKSGINGVVIQPAPLRSYPYGSTAAHVIGYLAEIDHWRLTKLADYGYKTKDKVGFGGIEEKYDYYLKQEDGGLSVEVDRRGKIVRVIGFKPPQSGKNIQLTIELKLQQLVEESLDGRNGCVVIMNPYSGGILAMANGLDFDPGAFLDTASRDEVKKIVTDKNALLLNRSIKGLYPPGSIFKCIVATAALESGKMSPSTKFFCQGGLTVGNNEFACWEKHGEEDLIQAIAHSCDVYFYKTGLLIGPQAIHDYAEKFGLAKPTTIELPYEAGGFIPSPLWKRLYRFKSWFDGDTANMSIGQGDVLVTPLQMARMMSVFANHGKLVRPFIVKAIDGQDVSNYHRDSIELPFKESTVDVVRRGLRDVVTDTQGTARILAALSVPVAGKTGTAEVSGKLSHGWFVGFFPYQTPRFVICVFLENGGSGQVATGLAKEIIEKMTRENMI
ncbi:MAG: penicillin-binding protein 2 [Candidatus Omnitrophica bacterium]|nr:penicillin-binding protein 2 [Candidatus Omnitrophota bacterium]